MTSRIVFDVAWNIYEAAHKRKRERDFSLVIYISTPNIFYSQGARQSLCGETESKESYRGKVTKHRTDPPPGTNIASPHIKPVTESTIALFPNDFEGDGYCK